MGRKGWGGGGRRKISKNIHTSILSYIKLYGNKYKIMSKQYIFCIKNYIKKYIHTYMCECVWVCVCVCVCVSMCVYRYMYNIRKYITQSCRSTNMYVSMYQCVYIYKQCLIYVIQYPSL